MKILPCLAAIVILTACSSGHHAPFDNSLPAIRDLNRFYEDLETSIGRSKNLTLREIGRVTYDGFNEPIIHIAYRQTGAPEKKRTIFIDAGIHGNEPAGVACAAQLISGLADGSIPLGRYDIDIIPIVNPWGWSHDIRFNKDGIDINRDFSTPRSREAKIVMDFLKGKTYDLVLDLHEDPAARGVYFYQYGRENKDVLKELVSRMKSRGYIIETDVNMIILKTEDGIIDAPMWGLRYVSLTDQLSLSNYCRLNLCSNVFTLETPVTMDLDKRIFVHSEAVQFLSNSLLTTERPVDKKEKK